MTALDTFRAVDVTSGTTCSTCGTETDCLSFWETHEPAGGPDHALCLPCLFDADGRYKHQPPEHVLRQYETIQSVSERDDVIVVTAASPLGTVQYLHHTEPELKQVDASQDGQHHKARIMRTRTLTGAAEAFTEGEHLARVSPYHDVATEYLRSKE